MCGHFAMKSIYINGSNTICVTDMTQVIKAVLASNMTIIIMGRFAFLSLMLDIYELGNRLAC